MTNCIICAVVVTGIFVLGVFLLWDIWRYSDDPYDWYTRSTRSDRRGK